MPAHGFGYWATIAVEVVVLVVLFGFVIRNHHLFWSGRK